MTSATRQKRTLVGIDLYRRLAEEGHRVFTTAKARELAPHVGIKESYLLECLHHLQQDRWIVPLRRGLYALSSTTPGVHDAHEFEIAMSLVSPAAISHWSAIRHHGLTEQVPRTVFGPHDDGSVGTPRARLRVCQSPRGLPHRRNHIQIRAGASTAVLWSQ